MELTLNQSLAIEQYYRKMRTTLIAYAQSALDDKYLAEEAVQETFRIACGKAATFLCSKNPQGWLFVTLKNVIQNIRRHKDRLNKHIVTNYHFVDDSSQLQYTNIEFTDTYSRILGEDAFRLLKMIILDKYTFAEAATEFGISIESCKKRVQRVKKKWKIRDIRLYLFSG